MVDLEGLIVCTGLAGTILAVGYMNRIASNNHRLRKIIEDRENDLDYMKAIILNPINKRDDIDSVLKFKRKQYPIPEKFSNDLLFISRNLREQYFDTTAKICSIYFSFTSTSNSCQTN